MLPAGAIGQNSTIILLSRFIMSEVRSEIMFLVGAETNAPDKFTGEISNGGARICFGLLEHWWLLVPGNSLSVVTCPSGAITARRNLSWHESGQISIVDLKDSAYRKNIFLLYMAKTWSFISFFKKYKSWSKVKAIVSTSDFWPDSIPAFYAKLKHPEIMWIASFYLFAPAPWSRDTPYTGGPFNRMKGLLYWLSQRPIYWITRRYADAVLVTSDPDIEKFVTPRRKRDRVIAVRGGVDISESDKYFQSSDAVSLVARKYDACFVGRFHYQKGVRELVQIWRHVCDLKPDAKLAMIGIGPLEAEVKASIASLDLRDRIDLLGYRDGALKHDIFKQSRMMLHPATYDSGGMAAAEGLAWGLPGIAFDLPALKTYYPKGMMKVKPGDLKGFATAVVELLNDRALHKNLAAEARDLIVQQWDWRVRAKDVYQQLFESGGGEQ